MPKHSINLLTFVLLTLGAIPVALADAGNAEFILLGEGGFSGSRSPSNNGYYTTGTNNYALTGNLGYDLNDVWEAGFGGGIGHLDYQTCTGSSVCSDQTAYSKIFRLFARYNFATSYGGEYSFTGLELTYLHVGGTFGNVTAVRPYAGYRLPLQDGWSVELSAGASLPLGGNTTGFTTSYDVQLGLAIPF